VKGAALLALVVITHYGYPDDNADWWFYIFRGAEGAILFLLLARESKGLALIACFFGAIEEAQTAVCGYAQFGIYPAGGGMCIEAFGYLPYAAVAAAGIVYLWRGRRDREN